MKNVRSGFTFTMGRCNYMRALLCYRPRSAFAQSSPGKVLLVPREGYSQDSTS